MLLALLLALPAPDSFPYDLQHPSQIIRFEQPELLEVSGLSPTDEPGVFVAIADERGEAFFVDIRHGKVLRSLLFREKGDFEGVEWVRGCLYAVKSDGTLFEARDDGKKTAQACEYATPLDKVRDDVEGLAFDPGRKALLIACKGLPEENAPRPIYAFDLVEKTLSAEPVYTIDPREVNRAVHFGVGEKHDKYFSPSALALHPVTRDLYVLSSALRRIAVLDYESGELLFAVRLDKTMLAQPEGLAFDAEGNLYIATEGKKGESGEMLRFDLK